MKFFALSVFAFCAAACAQNPSEFASAPMRFHIEPLNASALDPQNNQDRARNCGDEFHEKFIALVAEAKSLSWAMDRASQINEQYDQCVQRFGLTGYPEFRVGNSYLRTHAFLRAWSEASARERPATATPAAQPSEVVVVLPLPAIGPMESIRQELRARTPLTCDSRQFGTGVRTTCR